MSTDTDYPYYKNIRSPSQIGMSDKGTLSALGKDISGLIDYVDVLVSGKGKASATGGPLGNKFFLETGAKCNDSQTNQQVSRYIYVDNVPDGNIPFISSGMGVNFTEFEGLIPGAMGNLNVLNPRNIFNAFTSGANPPCQEITMQTIDNSNNKSSETHYVTTSDISGMEPCTFPNKKNPVTNAKCVNAFTLMNEEESPVSFSKGNDFGFPKDVATQLYYFFLSGISIYIFYRIMEKSNSS
jgi:hypothetical protein